MEIMRYIPTESEAAACLIAADNQHDYSDYVDGCLIQQRVENIFYDKGAHDLEQGLIDLGVSCADCPTIVALRKQNRFGDISLLPCGRTQNQILKQIGGRRKI